MQNIETIFTHENDQQTKGSLGIDEKNQLYWNGDKIVTEQRVTLNQWVNFAIIAGGISTTIIAMITLLSYFKVNV